MLVNNHDTKKERLTMTELTNEQIAELIKEAVEGLGYDRIIADATDYIDTDALIDAQPMKAEEIAYTYATAGFSAGIRFTLKNVELTDTEAVTIKLSDKDRERLERVAETYKDLDFSKEEVARLLLHDAIRAKYSQLPAEAEPYTEAQREADEEAYFEAFGLALVGEGDNVELVDLDELN